LFRHTASALALGTEAADDGETIVSELAANTLHVTCGVHSNDTCGDAADISPPGTPELWLYLRGSGEQCELVCKVFDSYPGWVHGGAPGHGGRRAAADAMSGRGLEVVHELSRGHWGYHLTRSRVGGRNVRGKAVWFTTAAPFAIGGLPRINAAQAMARLEEELVARGFGDAMVRADDPAKDTSVLAVCGELTVWCRAGCAWLRAPGLDSAAWGYDDLVEVAEQVVAAHETSCANPDLAEGRARMRA
jgi:hypothetical protein